MRKLLLVVIVATALWGTTSWTATPQWRTILETHKGGTEPFSNALVFTPATETAFRITFACSATGNPSGAWDFTFNWKDMTGISASTDINCEPGSFTQAQQKVFVLTPTVGVPVTLTGSRGFVGPVTYFGFYTVEELQ